MGSIGPVQLIIIALLILVLFGRGRISEMLGDLGKGVKSFKQGIADEDGKPEDTSARIEGPSPEAKPASQTTVDPQSTDRPDSSN